MLKTSLTKMSNLHLLLPLFFVCTTFIAVGGETLHKCGQNEIFKQSGFDCETCSNFRTVKCALKKIPKCYCKPGYVREELSKKCVLTKDCPQEQCKKPNEEYTPCRPDLCEVTCQNSGKGKPCLLKCLPHGCKCKQGFIRDAVTKRCILPKDCPKK